MAHRGGGGVGARIGGAENGAASRTSSRGPASVPTVLFPFFGEFIRMLHEYLVRHLVTAMNLSHYGLFFSFLTAHINLSHYGLFFSFLSAQMHPSRYRFFFF